MREKEIKHRGHVDRLILGTQATGTSWTSGGINVQIVPNDDDASIIIRFRGKIETKTTGYNGPAIIYSHTHTDFECARQVAFAPRIGLIAGKPTVDARTTLVFDGFDSNRRLGKRLIARVAKRRAEELFDQAQAIANQENKMAVCQAFERRLDGQLASINRRLDIARYVNAVFGPSSRPQLFATSSKDCVLIGISSEKRAQTLKDYLPPRKNSSPIEIWVHRSMLGPRMVCVAVVGDKIENQILPVAAQSQLLQALFGLATPPDEKPFEVSFQKEWIVIGLQNEQPKSTHRNFR